MQVIGLKGETQCHNDQSFFMKITFLIKEKLRGCVLSYAQALWRGRSQALLCAWLCNHRLIVDIKSQQGWLSNHFRFSINNTR